MPGPGNTASSDARSAQLLQLNTWTLTATSRSFVHFLLKGSADRAHICNKREFIRDVKRSDASNVVLEERIFRIQDVVKKVILQAHFYSVKHVDLFKDQDREASMSTLL
ncbi:hypothetical protein PInf_014197 [Phytophthora infestans]|nr:hypothetical protein PInf_014197 [Phytophthora infestans]